MADPRIRAWLTAIETRECVPSLKPIPGVSYEDYFAKILERFSNPEVGDTVQRLCLDGSNRQPKFVLPIITEALAENTAFQGLALEVALWCRYCAGTDDAGEPMLVNDDNAEMLTRLALEAKELPPPSSPTRRSSGPWRSRTPSSRPSPPGSTGSGLTGWRRRCRVTWIRPAERVSSVSPVA